MLISPALAQAPGAAGGSDIFVSLMPLILIFVVFYFLLIRPQQQRVKQHRQMVDNLKKGDQVVTGGGILGRVTRVEAGEATVMVEISPNVVVKISRPTIVEVLTKTPAAPANANETRPAAASGGGIGGTLAKLFKR